jgi:hypothetical protein
MIEDFDDFCLWMYVVIDDVWQTIAPLFKRPGPPNQCSDSELLTMILVGECRGWQLETDQLSNWRERPDLFPHVPSQSRFNRRRRHLKAAFQLMRQVVLAGLDLALDRQCVIDSLPIAVVTFHHAPEASREWVMHEASFGKITSKKVTIFGYKLHLLVTGTGVIVDFSLAPAHISDLKAGEEVLHSQTDLEVFGDKAYISAAVADDLKQRCGVHLHTLPRSNQKRKVSSQQRQLHNQVRQIIETVNGQLVEQFDIERNHAHTFQGLCTRLLSKLTAHTLLVYLNRLLGNAHPLQIKALAFPN